MAIYRRALARCSCGRRLEAEVRGAQAKAVRLRCSGCGAEVEAAPGADWYLEFFADGKRIRERFGSSRRDAERALAARMTAVREGRFWQTRKRCTMTLGEFADKHFLPWAEAHKRSFERDRLSMRNLCARFGAERLDRIDFAKVEGYRQDRLSGRLMFGQKRPTPATVNREIRCLTRTLSLAVTLGELEANPLRGLRMLKEAPGKVRYLSAEEISRLLEHCAEHLRGPVALALATGMRRGELLGLTWGEVDMRAGLVHLAPERCKSGKGRTIPLSPEARAVLRERWQQRAEGCELVFHRSGRALGDVKNAFRAACRRAGLGREVTFHTLRHTWASHAVMAGAPLPAVQAVLGHSTINVTMRYSHLAPAALAAAVRLASGSMAGKASEGVVLLPAGGGEDAANSHTDATPAEGGEVIPLESCKVR